MKQEIAIPIDKLLQLKPKLPEPESECHTIEPNIMKSKIQMGKDLLKTLSQEFGSKIWELGRIKSFPVIIPGYFPRAEDLCLFPKEVKIETNLFNSEVYEWDSVSVTHGVHSRVVLKIPNQISLFEDDERIVYAKELRFLDPSQDYKLVRSIMLETEISSSSSA